MNFSYHPQVQTFIGYLVCMPPFFKALRRWNLVDIAFFETGLFGAPGFCI